MANIQVAVINASTILTDQQVQAVAPALQTQVHRDFAPVWGIDADLTSGDRDEIPPGQRRALGACAQGQPQGPARDAAPAVAEKHGQRDCRARLSFGVGSLGGLQVPPETRVMSPRNRLSQ